jgi:hypothetical protein
MGDASPGHRHTAAVDPPGEERQGLSVDERVISSTSTVLPVVTARANHGDGPGARLPRQ